MPKSTSSVYFVYYALLGLADEIKARGRGGSVLLNLNKSQFERLPTLFAPEAIVECYGRTVAPVFELMLANQRQNTVLADLRDTLLPKLMSGEVRVREAEKTVEAYL